MTYKHEDCLALLEEIRWGGVPRCPYCELTNYSVIKNKGRYHCYACFTSYSVTVGTLFHKTRVDLHKWFLAIHLVLNSPGGISVRQLAQEISVNKNTACYMLKRLRKAMAEESEILQKLIEMDNL